MNDNKYKSVYISYDLEEVINLPIHKFIIGFFPDGSTYCIITSEELKDYKKC